ncbi:hypothetical protein KIW84_UN0613 [Lathyrus oleraceus]|nr:hypothetical protein KIW84_UN0613 [Pisum sativum]
MACCKYNALGLDDDAGWRLLKMSLVVRVALAGLDQFITKNAALTNAKEVDAHPIRVMKFSVACCACCCFFNCASGSMRAARNLWEKIAQGVCCGQYTRCFRLDMKLCIWIIG